MDVSSKQIVDEVFHLKQPDRIPVGICLGGSWPIFTEGSSLRELLSDEEEAADIFYRVNKRVHADFVTVGTGATAFLLEALGAEVRFSEGGAPEITSYAVRGEDDLDPARITEAVQSEKIQWLKRVAEKIVEKNQGQASIFVSGRAAFTLAGQLFGLENLSRAIYKNRSFVDKLLDFTTELSAAYYKEMLKIEGIDGIFIAEPSASGDVVSSRHFRELVVPHLQNLTEQLKDYRKLSILHICGNITDRLDQIPQTGVQIISLDTKVDLQKAREILAGRMGIAGNLDPVSVLETMEPQEVYENTTEVIDKAVGTGGFLLLPGCDISSRVSEKNVAAMVQSAHDWTPGHKLIRR